jgi:hypothetical protein
MMGTESAKTKSISLVVPHSRVCLLFEKGRSHMDEATSFYERELTSADSPEKLCLMTRPLAREFFTKVKRGS